jgi:deoxynucleotide monophosphate kinase-like protein
MLIGVTGLKNAGKDSVINIIRQQRPDTEVVRLGFADPLKMAIAILFDIPVELIDEWKNLPHIKIVIEDERIPNHHYAELTLRETLKRFGTEVGREYLDEDLWVDRLFAEKTRNFHEGKIVGIGDLRFNNEADRVKLYGGVIVKVHRKAVEENDPHKSEAGISPDLIDYHIHNNHSPGELRLAVKAMMAHLDGDED